MTIEEMKKHGGLIACANLVLGENTFAATPQNIQIAIEEQFNGDAEAFEEWAMGYIAGGCGISG